MLASWPIGEKMPGSKVSLCRLFFACLFVLVFTLYLTELERVALWPSSQSTVTDVLREKLWCEGTVSFMENRGQGRKGTKLLLQRALPRLEGAFGGLWRCPPPATQRVPFPTVPGLPAGWQLCGELGWAGAPTQSGAAGWTCFRRMWSNLDTTLDGREASVFSADCIPRIDNKHRHTIRFETKSAQMKSKARTILNCLCFKTLSGRMPHFHMKNMFLFAVVSSPSLSFQGTAWRVKGVASAVRRNVREIAHTCSICEVLV